MPKTNDASGATFYGHEGIVQAANGRLDQVDPSRNPDGSIVEGFESDERDIENEDGGDRFDGNVPLVADDAPELQPGVAEVQAQKRKDAEEAPLSLDGKMSGQAEAQPVAPADSQKDAKPATTRGRTAK